MAEWTGLCDVMDALSARADDRASRCVAKDDGVTLDTRAFVARAAAWRRAFAGATGHRWALYFDSTAEFAAALFGAWHAGKDVVLPGDTRPETLVALAGHTDGMAGDLPQALWPASVGVGTPGDSGHAAVANAEEGATGAPCMSWPALDPRATQVTIFTSGSTGAPTPIAKRLSQLDAEVHALQAAFGERIPADARVLTTVSHQHIYGLLFCVLWPLAAGRPMPVRRAVYHEELVREAGTTPAMLVSSPAHLRRMSEAIDWSGLRAALCTVFSSGGPLPPEAAIDAQRHLGQSPIEVFGSSETGGIAWRQRAVQADRWTALPGVAWRLQDGCLAVRSAHLATDDWYLCADRAQSAGADSFVLGGRADRIVKIEEKRVSLTQIEQTLAASPLVREARVVLVELDVGTRMAAALVLADEGRAMLADGGRAPLVAALRGTLADTTDPVALPRRWSFPDALPCNAQGKTTEAMLRDLFRRTVPRAAWLDSDGQSASADLHVSKDLAVFDGHFPDTPIVPGVAQVDWIMALAHERLPVPARERFHRLDTLKFQAVIRPGTTVRMVLDWQPLKLSLGFRLSSDEGQVASGRIVFREAGASESESSSNV